MMDITFFSSPIGLGHATRDIAIAQEFQNISTRFVSGHGASELIRKYGFDVENVYTPPKFEVKNGLLQSPLAWLWKYYKYYKDCKIKSSKIISYEKPRLVLSDEDFASLRVAHERKIPSILITDILETRFTKGIASIIEKKMNNSMMDIIKKCKVVILPDYGEDNNNIKYVGPIVRTTNSTRNELRKKFSFEKKTVLLSVGGTDAGRFLIEKAIQAFSKINDDVELVLVSGPSLHKNLTNNIRDFGFVENLHEIIYASDLVVSLAGKSTIDESKAFGTPGIFIPIKNHFEQEDNAEEFGYSYEDIFKLDKLIPEKLTAKRIPENFDGVRKAVQIIKNYI